MPLVPRGEDARAPFLRELPHDVCQARAQEGLGGRFDRRRGEARRAHEFSRGLFDEGLLATGIGFPTVPEGKARVRTIVTATHTRQQLDRAADILRRVAEKMGTL